LRDAQQRKSGAIEPEKDEEGNEINPHIPQYMAAAPWYLNAQGPGLKHQKDFRKQSVTQVGPDRNKSIVVFSGMHIISGLFLAFVAKVSELMHDLHHRASKHVKSNL
jgi:hypothetical protein